MCSKTLFHLQKNHIYVRISAWWRKRREKNWNYFRTSFILHLKILKWTSAKNLWFSRAIDKQKNAFWSSKILFHVFSAVEKIKKIFFFIHAVLPGAFNRHQINIVVHLLMECIKRLKGVDYWVVRRVGKFWDLWWKLFTCCDVLYLQETFFREDFLIKFFNFEPYFWF